MYSFDQGNAASKFMEGKPYQPALKIGTGHATKVEVPKNILPQEISVVVAVKNNQKGIDKLLRSLEHETSTKFYPREVIVVDNNSDAGVFIDGEYPFPVKVLKCIKTGPASARNVGAAASSGKWLLFTDSDCIVTDTLISGYVGNDNDSVAYAGGILIQGNDYLSKYYREQNALHPLAISNPHNGNVEPWCLVTANCLILKSAFHAVDGFNECFCFAGGEDTDLGFRLRAVGPIRFNQESVAVHHFADGLNGFVKRYIRYGKGNRMLHELYDVDFWPTHFVPNNPTLTNKFLAWLSVKAMRKGFKAV